MITNLLLKYLNIQSGLSRNMPNDIIRSLEVKEGNRVADIGSGGGYFSYEFSKLVGRNGRVTCVDIDHRYLGYINRTASKKSLTNIETVLASGRNLTLERDAYDIVFMKDVFHDIKQHKEYFSMIRKALKSDGKLAIIDFKINHPSIESRTGHCSDENNIFCIMEDCGFVPLKRLTYLDKQSYNIFIKSSGERDNKK